MNVAPELRATPRSDLSDKQRVFFTTILNKARQSLELEETLLKSCEMFLDDGGLFGPESRRKIGEPWAGRAALYFELISNALKKAGGEAPAIKSVVKSLPTVTPFSLPMLTPLALAA